MAVNIYDVAEGLSEGALRDTLIEAAEHILANGMRAVEAIE